MKKKTLTFWGLILCLLMFELTIAQSLQHPHIWVSNSDKQKILDNINQYNWASSLFSQLKERVDTKKNAHKTNPSAILSTIPGIPGIGSDRSSHTDILTSASEAAILYYLTDDTDYAQYAADILSHYTDRLSLLEAKKYNNGSTGLLFSDWWLESRALYPKIAVIYDLVYNYVNDPANTVFDLASNSRKAFDNTAAQQTVKTLVTVVFKSIGAPQSNHSVLAGNGALFNILMIDDDATRDSFFNKFYNDPNNERFDAYSWTLNHFTAQNIWPETFSYSKGSHEFVMESLEVIDRYKPELNIINNNLRILDGFTFYENYYYPSGAEMHFGDSGIDNDLLKGYQWMLKTATRKNMPDYINQAKQALKYEYDKRGGYHPLVETDRLGWFNPLQLLWGINIEDTVTAMAPKIESTLHVNHAGVEIQRNYNTSNVVNDGMMYYSGGASYVHTHSTGIDLNLYGKGYVLGAESGSGTYGSDEHENYRVRLAAHNTVIVNGSAKRGTNWDTKMSKVDLVTGEPKSGEIPISTDFSFSTQFIDDIYNNCLQQRTNSIIRTSANTGYYFDVFRSKGKNSNNYHDYIYHNIGDAVSLKYANNSVIPLSASTKYSSDESGSVTGWDFFENVKSSSTTNKAVKATFALNGVDRFMNVYMPSGVEREYATALSPTTKGAMSGYDKKKTPVMIMRKYGEAWDEPFVAIFEPTDNASSSIKFTSNIYNNYNKIVGAKVVSEVNGEKITDVIISNDSGTASEVLRGYDIEFTGRFGIIRTSVKEGKTKVSLYIGQGQQLTFNGKTINADSDGKVFLEYDLDYEYKFPIPSDNFLIETTGETCIGKNNGSVSINAEETNNYKATINGATYDFSNTTIIENLSPGIYDLCITIAGETFEQCYQVTIAGGTNLTGKINIGKETAQVSITEGTAPYTVFKNGKTILETYQSDFLLKIEDGDILKVISKSACQGELSKHIDLIENVQGYPNPSNGLFRINLPTNLKTIDLEMYNMQSQLISSKKYLIDAGRVSLDISDKPNGVYFVKVNLEKPVFVKVVKN